MAAEEQADVPVYKPSPFMKAAAQIIEASEGHVPDDLDWDPLTMSYGGGSGLPGDAIELPTELMMNLVGPGLAAARAKPTPEVPLAPSQERARKRLQQRKEAAAREAAEKAAQQEKEVEEPLDESWIDQLEQKDAKKKANREKAVQIRNARKKALKAHAAAKQEALESAEVQEEEEAEQVEPEPVKSPEPEDDEDDMQPVEQSKQRRKRQARQAAKQREEEEQARREEERKREEEQRLEAERKQQEAEKAQKERLEQERLEQERKRLEELREVERRRKEEELWMRREAEKQEAERRDAEKKEAERKRQEEVRERREQREQKLKEKLEREREQKERREKEQKEREQREQKEQKEQQEREQTRARKLREEEDDKGQATEEARVDGDRRRKGEPRESDQRARQGRKQDKDDVKENGEQPTQVKSLRQTLTPSQLRRQQRKRQREARRAAEAAAREEDESEEEVEVKPKFAERKQNERPAKKEGNSRETKEETDSRPKAEEGKRVRGGSVSSAASLDSTACKEEDADPSDAQRTSSELRKDAEAFPTPRSASGSFDQGRHMQEDPNLMQSVMGITTLMISQIPEQTDAESFRRQLDSWGFIGTYNFFYMPPDVSEGWGGRCVFINFIDQAMANMCMSAFQQCPSEGVATPYSVQGLEQNIGHFSQFVGAGDMVNGPLIVPTPTPSAWALNGAQAMMNTAQGKFSPQIRGQFHKTKMCAFHKKKKCTMGVACPFAHSREELNSPPDLSKTKLCVNFFKRKCNDVYCKFAHGHQELRATGNVYKTELCRAWSCGTCKAGDTCRYAHGVKELRGAQMGMGYMGYMEDDYMSVDGQMGCDVMGGLQGIWEDEAAAMQHYAGYNGTSSYPAQGSGEHRGRSAPSSAFSSGQPQDGTGDGFNDAMSDMGLSDVSTLCPGEGRLSRQQTAPPTASFLDAGRSVHGNVVLRVKGTFMESVFLDEEVERLPLRRSWSDGDLPQLQVDMEGEQD